MPSKNGAAVIVAFGRKGSQDPARMLARHGYGVLIFDRRGEGESDGDPNPYAWNDGEKDLIAAVDFLKRRPDVEPGRIGGIGLSVGGETFLQDGGAQRGRPGRRRGGRHRPLGRRAAQRPRQPVGTDRHQRGDHRGTAVFSNATPPPHLIDLVGQIAPRPMFLIYAPTADAATSAASTPPSTARLASPRPSGESPRPGTSAPTRARPREYEQRVVGFLDRHLRAEQP